MGEYILWTILIIGMFPIMSLVALLLMIVIRSLSK